MTDTTLTVTGGTGGVTARYDDMRACADQLSALAKVLLARLDDVAAVAVNPDIVEGAVLAPVTAARVAEHATTATVGPHGLGAAAAHLTASAVLLRGAVTAHQTLDEALSAATTVGKTVGAPFVVLFGGDMAGQWGDAINQPWDLLTPGWWKDSGAAMADNAYEHPWVIDGGVNDARLALDGISLGLAPTAPWVNMLFAGASAREGGAWPPIRFEDSVRDILGIGSMLGLFRNGNAEVTPLGGGFGPIPLDEPLPGSVRGLFSGVSDVSGTDSDGNDRRGQIRILQVRGADGVTRYVVEIPGTQNWHPTAGENPIDLTNNLRLMAGTGSVQNDAIVQAMHNAQIPPDAPIMLVGHSQGGITAASLASDPSVREHFHITNVVTAGSPIARFEIPADVHVLSLEHTRDAVPRLDAADNPDRPTWVTVHRDADGMTTPDGTITSVGASHPCVAYQDTAGLVDSSTDPGLLDARSAIDPFLTSDPSRVTSRDYQLTRTQ